MSIVKARCGCFRSVTDITRITNIFRRVSVIFVVILYFTVSLTFATTLGDEKVKCSVCGAKSLQTVINSTNSMGRPDFDLRPPEMKRSTMPYWIQRCPKCGYCNYSIDEKIDGSKKNIRTQEYLAELNDSGRTTLANSFAAAALLHELAGNYSKAADYLLCAAWDLDDADKKGAAMNARRRVLMLMEKAEKSGVSEEKDVFETILVMADLYRRTGQFEKAAELADRHIKTLKDENTLKIMEFERELISKKDTNAHNLSEAFPEDIKRNRESAVLCLQNNFTIKCSEEGRPDYSKKERKQVERELRKMEKYAAKIERQIQKGNDGLLTEKVSELSRIALFYEALGETDKALKINAEAVDICRKLTGKENGITPDVFAYFLDEFAVRVKYYGDPKQAIALFKEEISILEGIKTDKKETMDIQIARKYQKIGEVYYCREGMNKKAAIPYFEKALKVYREKKIENAVGVMEAALKEIRK